MARSLLRDVPFERLTPGRYGLAPVVTVTLHMPASGRTVPGTKALIDTGSEITWIYPRDVRIRLSSDVEWDPVRRECIVGLEIGGQVYYVECGYQDHPFAGTEHMLIGMNLLSNWLVSLHGRRKLLSLAHLDPEE